MAIMELPRIGKAPVAASIRKIAIEEHVMGTLFATAETYAQHSSRVNGVGGKFIELAAQRLAAMTSARLDEMNAANIDVAVLSLTGPGIEEMVNPRAAIDASRQVNDLLAEHIKASRGRFEAFAAVPLQDIDAAIAELRRSVDKRGLKGVLVNGYVGSGTDGTGQYVDEPQCDPFWKALSELRVPLYYIHGLRTRRCRRCCIAAIPSWLARRGVLLQRRQTCSPYGIRRRVRSASWRLGHSGTHGRDVALLCFAYPARVRIQHLWKDTCKAPSRLSIGELLGNDERELERSGVGHSASHRRLRSSPFRDGLSVRHVDPRSRLDRARAHQ